MINISHIPQTHSLNPPQAVFGQFDPGRISNFVDRQPASQGSPSGPTPPIVGSGISFYEASERYFREEIERNRSPRGQDFIRSLLRSRIYPAFAHRPLDQITRSEIREVLRITGTTRPKPYKGAPTWGCEGRANSMFTFLRGFFLWCEDRKRGDLLDHDPCAGLHVPYKRRERERVLNPQEIKYFWKATEEIGFPVGPIAQLLLLTAQRRGEIANAYGGQVDRTQRMLSVPIMSTKPRRNHLVPLSTAALQILDALPHGDPRDLLFPRSPTKPNLPIWSSTLSTANKRIYKRMVELAREDFVRAGRDPANAYIEWFCFHDLRRTAATLMCQRDVPVEIVDKVMNHANGKTGFGRTINSVTRIYVRHEFLEERRAALQDLGQYVRQLVS